MFCPKCGKKLQDGDLFCWNCGEKIRYTGQDVPGKPERIAQEELNPAEKEWKVPTYDRSVPEKGSPSYDWRAPVVKETPYSQNVPVQNSRSGGQGSSAEDYDISKLPTKKEQGIRSIYILDFVMRMGRKTNLPLLAYLFLNVVLLGLVAMVIFSLPLIWGIAVGFLFYLASVSIALSPLGELMLRHQTGCRKIKDPAVIERLEPLFREVYYKAKKKNPMISGDVRMFINEDESPNAFATGRKTICVTRGLLNMGDEEIKATLGHEFGHLSHKDTDRILVVAVGNTVITGICVMIEVGVIIMDAIMGIVAALTGNDEGVLIALFSALSRALTLLIVRVFMKVWTAIGVALCMKTSRGNEYEADEFSCILGYGEGLCRVLSFFGGEKPKGLFANLASSHPDSASRIERIRSFMQNSVVEGREVC
ncbi:MAG: M48 family metalloprotease [Lachnospiraceae bacterium]|nr:M48 family metalloprotease [Lachnospiraceae bacterium]